MSGNWWFLFQRLNKNLSLKSALFACLAVLSALVSKLLSPYLPDGVGDWIGEDAVDELLRIIASSMLIVVTFSMQTMVAAYSSATQNSTPRSTTLIIEDSKAQNAISIFLGAFIFSIVSLIALATAFYGKDEKVIMLGVTIGVIIAVVWKVIRWVGELRDMGRVSETIKRLEHAGTSAFNVRAKNPNFGCHIYHQIPTATLPIYARSAGHVQNIAIKRLAHLAEEHDLKIYISCDVGDFVLGHTPIAYLSGYQQGHLDIFNHIRREFSIGANRTFENDPRYSLTVLSGVALHALSPSINDPGTAIDVIGSLTRMLAQWENTRNKEEIRDPKFPRLYKKPLEIEVLFEDAYYAIANDATGQLSVIITLQEALQELSKMKGIELSLAARKQARLALRRAEKKLTFPEDISKLKLFKAGDENSETRH
jgi:uncharacterized membrane protein